MAIVPEAELAQSFSLPDRQVDAVDTVGAGAHRYDQRRQFRCGICRSGDDLPRGDRKFVGEQMDSAPMEWCTSDR
ncbi:hypothetical protein ACFVKB_29470 [Rhodococcus sp. NPDC127530]|uniref:hypothetical protein n=1 Tax=unclassified Rhodococcus (in: high G+C Gram-positive bacteria) TaxID=192944 RepID=UPI00363ABE3A